MTLEEFIANHLDQQHGEVYANAGTKPVLVYHNEEVEHKTVYTTEVYQIDDDYFEVVNSRDNCGYWGDGERYPPEVRKVVPRKKIVEITEWEGV